MTEPDRSRRGKYELHSLIGEGAMGVVWKAYDTVLRRFVALKLLGGRFAKARDMQERFLREARAAGAIQHPNIVTVYDLGDADGQPFIAMEFVDGRDLSDIIAGREPLSLERKLDIVIEVLAGLQYAHERGVIHRDVKPSNVRVMPDGRVKIMDFGIARLQTADTSGAGAIVGTPTYMAPEQITNGAITAATDVFATGGLLYELLSFQKPFEGETVHGVLYQVLTTEPKPLRTIVPSIPAALERVVAKAMRKVPGDRYRSAADMRSALVGIRTALSGGGEDITQRLGEGLRWTPWPGLALKLVSHAPLRWRLTALGGLAAVSALLLYSSRRPPVETPIASAPAFGDAPGPATAAVSARRDSALAARERAVAAGAPKNNVPSIVLAETMLQASEQALQAGDQARAVSGYVAAVAQYRKAREEARALEADARHVLGRVASVVEAIPAGPAAANAGVYFARAESLLEQQDFTLARVAAQSAEQIGVAAGIAPASDQPPGPRAAIEVLLADLGRAIASERVVNVRVLYPAITDRERASWEQFFAAWARIDAQFAIDQFTAQGAAASAEVRAQFEYVPEGGGVARVDRRRFAMAFEKREEGWRVAAVSELR